MKKHFIINLLVLLTIGFCFSNFSCSKDKDDTNIDNSSDNTKTSVSIIGKWHLVGRYYLNNNSWGNFDADPNSDVYWIIDATSIKHIEGSETIELVSYTYNTSTKELKYGQTIFKVLTLTSTDLDVNLVIKGRRDVFKKVN